MLKITKQPPSKWAISPAVAAKAAVGEDDSDDAAASNDDGSSRCCFVVKIELRHIDLVKDVPIAVHLLNDVESFAKYQQLLIVHSPLFVDAATNSCVLKLEFRQPVPASTRNRLRPPDETEYLHLRFKLKIGIVCHSAIVNPVNIRPVVTDAIEIIPFDHAAVSSALVDSLSPKSGKEQVPTKAVLLEGMQFYLSIIRL